MEPGKELLEGTITASVFLLLSADLEKDVDQGRGQEEAQEEDDACPGCRPQALPEPHALPWEQAAEAEPVAQGPAH